MHMPAVCATFSFGSAFAYTTDQFYSNVNQAEAKVLADLNTAAANVKASLYDANADSYSVKAAQWSAAVDVAVKELTETIQSKSAELRNDEAAYGDYEIIELISEYPSVDTATVATYAYTDDDAKLAAAKAQFAVDKAAYLANIAKIDLSVYSTTTLVEADKVTFNGTDYYSYYAAAKAIVDKLTEDITAVVLADTDTDADAVYAKAVDDSDPATKTAIKELFDAAVLTTTVDDVTTYTLTNGDLKTIAQEEKEDLQSQAGKASLLAQVSANVSAYYKSFVDSADYNAKYVNDVKAEMDAYTTAWTYLINNEIETSVTAHAVWTTADLYQYSADAETLANAIALAEKYRAWKDEDGNNKFDSELIDEAIEAAKAAAYGAGAWTGTFTYGSTTGNMGTVIEAECKVVSTLATSYQKAVAKKVIEDALDAVLTSGTGYYDPEKAQITAKYDALIAEVEAATTLAELRKVVTESDTIVTTKVPALTGIKQKSAVKADIVSGIPADNLEKYMNYVNAGLDSSKDGYRDFTALGMNDGDGDFWQNFFAEKGARKASEVAAFYNDALAAIDAVPTKGQLSSEKTALEAQIEALPATITLEDKAAVEAAYEAYANSTCAAPANLYKLNLAIDAVAALDKTAAQKMVTDLSKLTGGAVIANKDAYKAADAAVNAFNDACDDTDSMYNYRSVTKISDTTASDGLATIQNLEAAEIVKAVNALPFNITEADKAAVEAARAAYDAYAAEYTVIDVAPNGYNPAEDTGRGLKAALETLTEAEAVIAASETTMDDEAAKAYVQDLSIVARSTKTAKGNIKVTINADVQPLLDAGFTVEYKFYRSTKARSGYGKARVVKTTNTYINTTGVKGTRYYYKAMLTVKNADGEVIATTPLTQCKYACRVK